MNSVSEIFTFFPHRPAAYPLEPLITGNLQHLALRLHGQGSYWCRQAPTVPIPLEGPLLGGPRLKAAPNEPLSFCSG